MSGMFVNRSKKHPINAVITPQSIQRILYGQIHNSGKKPISKTTSGSQMRLELGGMAKLKPMLKTHSPHATMLAIFLRFDFAVLAAD